MKISNQHLHEVCKIGQGNDCCRYIMVGGLEGVECVKHSDLKKIMDARVANKEMTAQGDNCDGISAPSNESETKSEVKMRIVDRVSQDTGITPEALTKYHCVSAHLEPEHFQPLCDGPCEACWNQEDAQGEAVDPNVLATVTVEEAEQYQKAKDKLEKAQELSKQAIEMAMSAKEENGSWFDKMRNKYGITGGGIRFDAETKTIRKVEAFDRDATVLKMFKMLFERKTAFRIER